MTPDTLSMVDWLYISKKCTGNKENPCSKHREKVIGKKLSIVAQLS
jgi:hypothetical protein